MFIQTEQTPNPETIKFIPGETVMVSGTAQFDAIHDCGESPLAKRLFAIDGVKSVFLGPDFISVTKSQDKSWPDLKTFILAAVMEHFSLGLPVVNAQIHVRPAKISDIDQEIVKQIEELLETRVRPAVQQDGGDIEFDSYEDGIVYLRMRGACSGCPSSSMTLKAGIENMLRHFIPEIVEVRQTNSL